MLARRQLTSRGFGSQPERVRERDKDLPPYKLARAANFGGNGASGVAVGKTPANRLFDLRRLAAGEQCTVRRFDGWCACLPETTVWGHTNTLKDQKGLGYKGHDAAGFFVGHECHSAIDQGGLPAEVAAALVVGAQARTRIRLAEIAGNIALKPWRVAAARWALEQLGATPAGEK